MTWQRRTGFVYDAMSLEKLYEFKFNTDKNNEGWGITFYPVTNSFVVSDGSHILYFWDVNSFKEIDRVSVSWPNNGGRLKNLNELEYDPVTGYILSNVWYQDYIVAIDPRSGIIQASIDLSSLWPQDERDAGADVLNGISTTDVTGEYLVTGKLWPTIYRISFF